MIEHECDDTEPHDEHVWPYDIEVWAHCSGGGR